MKIDDIYEVLINEHDINGNGITRINNFVVFVKNGLKDELIKIKIIKVNKRYAEAKIIEIIKKSPLRKETACPYYLKCGGCNLLHIDEKEENLLKENYIKNLFNSYKVNEIEASLFNNYRNKVTFHIFNSKLGFYNSNSNDLVEIDNCLLLDKDINNLIPKIKTLDLTNIKEIMIRKAVFNNEILMSFKGSTNEEKLKEFGKENNITSLSLNDDVIYGKSYITEIINDLKYTINKDSFFQVNTTCMIKLYDKVKEYAKNGNNLLDLYCGTGTIGMYLKDSYKYILGVEENSFAINSFNINKKINNIKNIDFKCMDASNIKIGDFDTVVVDPPRSGLSKKVINNLLNKKCKRIVYVSCNPKTLYKDIKLLEESYKVISLTPFNMFPKTKHIETVCLLEKE